MADIDVVPKRRTNVWLWIVLALIVLVAIWWAFARSSVPVRTGLNLVPTSTIAGSTGAVVVL